MTESSWIIVGLCLSAFLAGAMNSIAGGGTLLTFPALLGVLPAAIANATSTVALLPGSIASAIGYHDEIRQSGRFVVRMLLPSLVGGTLGAILLENYREQFADLVPWLVLSAATLFLVQPFVSKWIRRHRPDHEPGRLTQLLLMGFQFLIALYGGYFGAGIGILMLAALGFMGVGDMHRMNGVKTCLAALINLASLVVFLQSADMIVWHYAWPMIGSSIVGGYAGARLARRVNPKHIRWVVIAIGFGLTIYYFAKG